ncbi:transcriptional regulator [Brevibacillus centrosporus]|uniref:transcriptional regulator n=1 Tax=Brevibacillus centrosporus TaxID=54910 RepID=UPI001FE2B509|nr:transcriptional regulator [Brevibacillus centrosporus]MEC2133490.1 transcriptional regulator [Brevibacillus centrosporus]
MKQKWLAKEAELNKATITRVTSSDEYTPNLRTIKKILQALRKIDPNVKQDDFWTM